MFRKKPNPAKKSLKEKKGSKNRPSASSEGGATRPAPAPKRASSRRQGAKKRRRPEPNADWQIKNPDACGIDIGAREHWVAVPQDRATPAVRCFGTCTPDHDEIIAWLRQCGVQQVAMESTGMYWLALYERLEEAGFEVILADARQTKGIAGRKSDLRDCEWIRQLHTYGLLRAAFRPMDAVCRLRTLQRHRRALVESASSSVHHMQKALDGMNLHVHHALSDLTGQSGMAMIEAILAGEHDPRKLAALADRRVKKTPAQLEAALTGNYRDEELFVLGQALANYKHFQQQIAQCERKTFEQLAKLEELCRPAGVESVERPVEESAKTEVGKSVPDEEPGLSARTRARRVSAPLVAILHRIFGVDLTAVPGLAAMAVLTLLSEIGPDMSRWRHAKAFASWLGLCPNHRISGGRLLSASSRKVVNRAATALRLAAMVAGKTDTPLGAFYRRKAAQFGAPKAITATAHKMACLIYEMIRTGQEYRAIDASSYQKHYDEQRLNTFRKRARALGYELVELQKAA